ncbi:MAG: MATE family efflux transporter [Paracoccaceae bacterium]
MWFNLKELKDIINSKRVLKIALPMMLSNITVPLLGFVDTAVIGQLGDAKLIAALGLGSILISTLYWLCGFLRMGTTGLTAQAIGSKQTDEVSLTLLRGLLLGVFLGFFILVIAYPIFFIFFLLSPAEVNVETLALQYAEIRVLSAPFAIATIPVIGWLIALEKTLSVLFIQLFINLLNIILNLYFVFELEIGIEGVAYATLISEIIGFLLALFISFKALGNFPKLLKEKIFKKEKWKKLLYINSNIFLRSLLLELVFISFFFWASSFGTNILAINQILIQFLHISAYALDGFAFASEVLVGIYYGKKNIVFLRRSILLCASWSAFTAIIFSVVFFIFGDALIKFMTNAEEVLKIAKDFQIWIILVPLFSFPAYIMDGVFFGSTHTSEMRRAMIFSTVIYFILAIFLTSIFQNSGLWTSLYVFFGNQSFYTFLLLSKYRTISLIN